MVRPILLLASAVAFAAPVAAQSHGATLPPPGDAPTYAPDVIAAARQDVLPLRECYDRAPRNAWREVRYVTIVLDAHGAVTDLVIRPNGRASSAFRCCMLPVIQHWHLPAPTSGHPISLTYPAQEIRSAVEQLAH